MKLTTKDLEDLYFEGGLEKDGLTLEVVEEGEWTQDHKTQSLELIFTDGEKHYRGYVGRSGSHWNGWEYDSGIYGGDSTEDVFEVQKKEVTVTRWVTVH